MTDIFESILGTLRSSDERDRERGLQEFQDYVQSSLLSRTPDEAHKIWNDVISNILFPLTDGPTTHQEKLIGISAIDKLLAVDAEASLETKNNLYRLLRNLKNALPNNNMAVMQKAAETFGRIFAVGGNLFAENLAEIEVQQAVDLLSAEQNEHARVAGSLILIQLAMNAPSFYYAHTGLILDRILVPLRDSRDPVRRHAARLLSVTIEVISVQEAGTADESPLLIQLAGVAARDITSSSTDIVFGALLIYRELFTSGTMVLTLPLESSAASTISSSRSVEPKNPYLIVCSRILKLRTHKDAGIRKEVVSIIPVCAGYDAEAFQEQFLPEVMKFLMQLAGGSGDRSYVMDCLGRLAMSIGTPIANYINSFGPVIQDAVEKRKTPRQVCSDETLFGTIALLAKALGPAITKFLSPLIPKMFTHGLSPSLCTALPAIAKAVPPMLAEIQACLLDEISLILSGHRHLPPGAPASTLSIENKPRAQKADRGSIRLALTTLQTFNWSGCTLTDLVQYGVLPYLDDDDRAIRLNATLATCTLFMTDPIAHHTSNHSIAVITEVLDKLITVALADPDQEIRTIVLKRLDDQYDKHLAQVENIRVLFMVLNDESHEVRIQAVNIIGRLANRNPATVMPSLRKALIQLLTELEYSTDVRRKITTAEVLTALLKSTERLIKPYAPSLLRVFLPKAKESQPNVSRRMIECIGLLAQISGEEIMSAADEIMELLLETLQDPQASAKKKDSALLTLGQVCTNTSMVVDPLVDHPELFAIFRRFLRAEGTSEGTKRRVLQVMGILGAIDPYTRKRVPDLEAKEPTTAEKTLQQSVKNVGSQPDVFYQSVVINSLLNILGDASLVSNHPVVIEVILAIFKTQGMKCVPFLPQIIPAFTAVCRGSNARHQDYYLQQMSIIVQIIGSHIRNYIQEVFELTRDLWGNPELHLPIVGLVESLATAMAAEFKRYLPTVLPQLLTVFDEPTSEKRGMTEVRVFHAMLSFGSSVEEYIHLLLPVLLVTIEKKEASPESRKAAAATISGLAHRVSLADNGSRIVHPLVRALPTASPDLRNAIMDTMCVLLTQLGADFAVFVPIIKKTLVANRISSPKFDSTVNALLKGEPLPQDTGATDSWSNAVNTDPVAAADLTKLVVNQQHLKAAWDIRTVRRPEDWSRWFKRFSIELLKVSTSHALRACVSLANTHAPLAQELFHAAFYSCWVELNEAYQENLVQVISTALSASENTELRLTLLGLVEFMEHEDKALPIDNHTLGDIAVRANAFAKALHYKEFEFFSHPGAKVVEHLLGINTKLQQKDAALGLLNNNLSKDIEPVLWYEQLGRWQDALDLYLARIEQHPSSYSQEAEIGRLRCLHALGEWDDLSRAIDVEWSRSTTDDRRELAPMAAAAAWVLRRWDDMDEFVTTMAPESPDRSFYRAILSVHRNQFDTAATCIALARDSLQTDMSIVEDYSRVYNSLVRVQLLSELEEIIAYKKNSDQPERQQIIRRTWAKRLQGCQRDVDVWQRVLQLRTLVLSPSEDSVSWIKFANLCRKAGRYSLAEKALNNLLSDQASSDTQIRAPPAVVYAHLKLLWAIGDKNESLAYLTDVCANLSREIGLDDPRKTITGDREAIEDIRHLLARAYLKQGEWRQQLQPEWNPDVIDEVVHCYRVATQLDPRWYKAWHTWALCNFEVINYLERQDEQEDNRDEDAQARLLFAHILSAVEGFFRSIALGGINPIQDSLRLLTLWFRFGAAEQVSQAVGENFKTVSIDTWLEVVPQLIARIQTPSPNIRLQINTLLTEVGKHHPQALIYPLTVASKSTSEMRKSAALSIMDRLRDHSPILVEQALTVSHELIRVAILWHELWHEYLEEASRLYFTEKNPEAMIEHLEILHQRLDQGPETTREASFAQVHGKDLREAREACLRYLSTRDNSEMDKAWDIYYTVFRRIEKQLPQLTTIDLQYVSPKLLQAENLELAVPGTYKSGRKIIRITRFTPKLSVIASKQRPRRLAIMGDDGKEYQFCLKGHEDLRQDERVMQVFGLVNTLLAADNESFMRKLHIQGFAVIPLAPNVGLLRWVQHADTLHVLVSDYRQARKIHLQIEYRLMLMMAPDYVNLTMLQKLEVFKYALDNTTGQDLYHVLWLTSANSEAWLERRSTYTRSLAVSSMVGHILGLGDRHPANLLLDRITGKVVHIDFGDCFEIAMHREKFPEKIPFRLTRMLTNAMEVSGIEGSFRHTSEITMKVLRDNKEPLMAVLEAFVYDPLISWRLTAEGRGDGVADPNTTTAAAAYTKFAGGPRQRRAQLKEDKLFDEIGEEVRNERALDVYMRVQRKLAGRDFNPSEELSVEEQVEKLIKQATSLENLCQCFPGWCPFW